MASPEKCVSVAELGRSVIAQEASALERLAAGLGESFELAVRAVVECDGNVILTGIGKSLLIAQKISASLASTGTPSIAIHPVDALHGDIGRIRRDEVLICLSNSGASREVLDLLDATSELSLATVAITSRCTSAMAEVADIVLDIGPLDEASPMGVAPTVSTTAMLALGDALTLCVARERGFTVAEFARNHPGGSLGRRLRPVASAMRPLRRTAVVDQNASISTAVATIAERRCGIACVCDHDGVLSGVFTDGDLRRFVVSGAQDLDVAVGEYMCRDFVAVPINASVEVAVDLLRTKNVNSLPVIDADRRLCGLIDIQDVA